MSNNHSHAAQQGSSEDSPLLPTSGIGGIAAEGESGRHGFDPRQFFIILWRSSCTASKLVNLLWPFVPVALLLHISPGLQSWKFVTAFFFGGLRNASQKFHAIVSEVGTGLLLVAAFGLLIPSAFYSALKAEVVREIPGFRRPDEAFTETKLREDVLRISQATSIALMVAFLLYTWYQASSQHSIFDEVIEQDEHRDTDRHEDMAKPKFTMTEALLAIGLSLILVTVLLILLVEQIEHVVESGVPDQFLGLILLPLVEKSAEHLTAIDEAWGKPTFR